LMDPCGAARTSLSNSWFSSLPTTGSRGSLVFSLLLACS
jgi:hypothetical protein